MESTYLDLCSELSWANDGAPCQCRQYGPAYERCIFAIRIDPAALVSTSAVFLTRAEAQEIGTDESNIAARGMRNKDDKIIARVGASVLPISLTDLINPHRTSHLAIAFVRGSKPPLVRVLSTGDAASYKTRTAEKYWTPSAGM